MQDPVQKSVVFPERVKSCNLYRVTGLYSLSILKESKSRRVKSCNPQKSDIIFFSYNFFRCLIFILDNRLKCIHYSQVCTHTCVYMYERQTIAHFHIKNSGTLTFFRQINGYLRKSRTLSKNINISFILTTFFTVKIVLDALHIIK